MAEPDTWMAAERQHRDTDLDALVKAVAARDRAAFTALYKATSRRLYGLCLRVTQQPELADDALSETYLQVWRQAQHQALGQLDEQQRQQLALAYFRGYSHSELADYTGLPPGTVKSRLRRGVERLRSLMQGDSHEQA